MQRERERRGERGESKRVRERERETEQKGNERIVVERWHYTSYKDNAFKCHTSTARRDLASN